MQSFRLGEHWPDWWADAVTDNRVITHNLDGRWRGGPDIAYIHTPERIIIARKGDWIVRAEGNAISTRRPSAASSRPLSDRHAVGE
jgi:hypothetical protein